MFAHHIGTKNRFVHDIRTGSTFAHQWAQTQDSRRMTNARAIAPHSTSLMLPHRLGADGPAALWAARMRSKGRNRPPRATDPSQRRQDLEGRAVRAAGPGTLRRDGGGGSSATLRLRRAAKAAGVEAALPSRRAETAAPATVPIARSLELEAGRPRPASRRLPSWAACCSAPSASLDDTERSRNWIRRAALQG